MLLILLYHASPSFVKLLTYTFLIPALIVQIFSPAELTIPIGKPTKEAKAKIEIHPVTAEAKVSKWSM